MRFSTETEIRAYPRSIMCPWHKFKIDKNQHSLYRQLATSLSAHAFCGDEMNFLFFLHIWKLNVAYSNFLLKTQVDFESSLIQGWRLSTMQNSEVILKSKYSLFSLAHHLNDQLIEITESKVWTLFSLGEQTITVDQIKGTDHLWNTNHDLFLKEKNQILLPFFNQCKCWLVR